MGLGRMFDAYMDWTMEGSAVTSFAKLFGSVAVGAAVIASPFVYVAHQNNQEMQRTFADLDSRRTAVFQSVRDCTAQHFSATACTQSQDAAINMARGLGTALSYSSGTNCQARHGQCREESTLVPITTYVNNVPITTYTESTSYHPAVLGWQAARDDLSVVVPLYQSSDPAVLLRRDGQSFTRPGL
ncbi:MAG: hypothetical protein KJ667_02110 [Alphaproteobacteria bacterium]|nr:hypothetical protein [Alphaproteobacteria bacterium]